MDDTATESSVWSKYGYILAMLLWPLLGVVAIILVKVLIINNNSNGRLSGITYNFLWKSYFISFVATVLICIAITYDLNQQFWQACQKISMVICSWKQEMAKSYVGSIFKEILLKSPIHHLGCLGTIIFEEILVWNRTVIEDGIWARHGHVFTCLTLVPFFGTTVAVLFGNTWSILTTRRSAGCLVKMKIFFRNTLSSFSWFMESYFMSFGISLPTWVAVNYAVHLYAKLKKTNLKVDPSHILLAIVNKIIVSVTCIIGSFREDPVQCLNRMCFSIIIIFVVASHFELLKSVYIGIRERYRRGLQLRSIYLLKKGYFFIPMVIDILFPEGWNSNEFKPLHYACKYKNLSAIKFFMRKNELFNSRDGNNCTPLNICVNLGHLKILKFIIDELKVTCRYDDVIMTALLPDRLARDHSDDEGNTPLHVACMLGNIEMVKYLSQVLGCDPETTNHKGTSCMSIAIKYRKLNVINFLIENFYEDLRLFNKLGESPVFVAAESGYLDALKLFHAKFQRDDLFLEPCHMDVNCNSILHVSSAHGFEAIVRYCVEELKFDINSTNKYGQSCLHLCVEHGQLNIVQYLLANPETDITVMDGNGQTPLELAAEADNMYVIEEFILGDPLLFKLREATITRAVYEKCLLGFCAYGRMDIVKDLIEHKNCDPNCTNKQGMACLHLAVIHNHAKIVRYLIENTSAELESVDICGRSPAFIATEAGYYEILKCMLDKDKRCATFRISNKSMLAMQKYIPQTSLLHEASLCGHIQILEYLIEFCGCDLSWTDQNGSYPLYSACLAEEFEVAEFLIEKYGCDPNKKVCDGKSCLHITCNKRSFSFFKKLIDHYGCNYNCADNEGTTPLYVACEKGCTDIAKFLIEEKKCDVQHRRNDSKSYVHAASGSGGLELVQYLVDTCKLEPDCKDSSGLTPLLVATEKKHLKVIRYLVVGKCCKPSIDCFEAAQVNGNNDLLEFFNDQHGILCGSQNSTGDQKSHSCTYVHSACTQIGKLDVIKEHLQYHHCTFNIRDGSGKTPVYYACLTGDLDVVKYLIREHGCVVNWPCLQQACMGGHLSVIQYLLDILPYELRKLEFRMPELYIPGNILQVAACSGDIATIKYFIDKNYDPNYLIEVESQPSSLCEYEASTIPLSKVLSTFKVKMTPMVYACKYGHLEAMKFFIQKHNALDHTDVSLIHSASMRGHLHILRYFIENRNINSNSLDRSGQTPLFYACVNGHLNIVKYLVCDNHCQVYFAHPQNWHAIHVASVAGKLEIVRFLKEVCRFDADIRDFKGRSPLFLACTGGHISVVEYLANYHWKSDYVTSDGYSYLHGAAIAGKLDVLKYLINIWNSDSNRKTSNGSTALHLASEYGRVDVVQYLCELEGTDINLARYDGMTALHVAVRHGHTSIVDFLTKNAECDINVQDKHLRSPLYLACEEGKFESVSMLINIEQCDPNLKSDTGQTCLHLAVEMGDLAIMNCLLISSKTIKNVRNKEGFTPLFVACYHGELEMVRVLLFFHDCDPHIQSFSNQSCLHAACASDNVDLVNYLVNAYGHVYDINGQDDSGVTPIFEACSRGRTSIVKYLMESTFSDPNIKTYVTQQTCLHAASTSGNVELVEFLLNVFDVDTKDAERRTPLHVACKAGHTEVAKFLTEVGHCNTGIITNCGFSCLHEACASGELGIVEYILHSYKCDINKEDSNGYTPFLIACRERNAEVLDCLIDNCSNKTHKTKVGWSCLHVASYYGRIELIRHLAPKFRKDFIESKDNFGITPLYLACQEGHVEIIKYLVEESQCNLKHCADNGWTCLHAAISTGKLEVIKCISSMSKVGFFYQLLQPFYSSALVKLSSYNPLHIAAEFGQLDIVKYLIKELNYDPISLLPDNILPIHLASFGGHHYVVKYLSDNHSGVNSTDKYGHTPLHFAAAGGHPHMIEYLVQKHKYDFSTVTSECLSCQQDFRPYYLEKVHSFDTFRKILKRFSTTPLHCAAAYGHVNTLDYLFNVTKCDPLVRDGSGDTLLHVASRNGHLSILKYLLKDKLIDHYVKGACNATAIHSACVNGHLDVVKFLIEEASKDDSLLLDVDKHNRTPLHYACAGGYVNVVHYIRSQVMCDASSMIDNDGNSPLHYAVMRGNIEIIELLMGSSLSDRKFIPRMINPSLVNLKETPIDLTHADTNCDIKQYFLNQETMDAAYKTPESLSDTSSLNIIVFGSTQVGKTSLVKKLSSNESVNWLNIHFLSGRDSKPYPNPSRTVLHTTTHKKLGSVTFHDMAGEERFHGNHKLILQQVLNPLILLVVSLDKDVEGIDLQLMYWFRLISTAGKDYDVIVVGSFIDKPGAIDKVKFIEEKCREYERKDAFCFRGFVQCNCCVSCKGIENLQKLIVSIRNEIFAEQTENENATIEKVLSPTLFRYLQHLSRYSVSITLEELINRAKNISSPDANMTMLCDIKLLNSTCEYLHKYSRIFYFKHEGVSIEKSVIILDRDLLLKLINNYLMASLEDIKDGVVEEHLLKSNISKLFPQKMFDYDLAVKYLMFSSFCTEISCDKLNSIKKLRSASRYYVFPELISPSIARPECSQLWNTSGETMLWSTLCLKCANEQSFTPELLHALFIKVINKEKDVDNLTLWSNGIGLVHGNGTRSLIEVTDLTTKIYLVLQCKEGNEEDVLHLVNQRSKLFFMVKSLVQNFCSAVDHSEFFLYMDQNEYPPKNFKEIPFSKVADAIVKGVKKVVLPNNCLVELSKFIYKDFFKEAKREDSYHLVQNRASAECVPTILLNRLRDLYSTELFQKPLKSAPILYRDLYNKVIQFSIFIDRPVYDMCEVPIDIEICKGYFNELGSVALQLLRNNWSAFNITMKFNTDWLAGEMNRTGLLSDDDLENVVRVKSFLTESKRAIIMMISLKKAVASDAQHLKTFLNILKVRPVFYEKSIMLLEECILSVTNLDSLEWNIGNECHCLRICDVISAKWKEVGDFLNLTNDRLEEIALKHQDDVYKCCHSVLEDWLLRDQGSHPKIWETVFHMLHKLEYLTVAHELQSALGVKLA